MHNAHFAYAKVAHSDTWEARKLGPIVARPYFAENLETEHEVLIAQEVVEQEQLENRIERIEQLGENEQHKQIVAASFAFLEKSRKVNLNE